MDPAHARVVGPYPVPHPVRRPEQFLNCVSVRAEGDLTEAADSSRKISRHEKGAVLHTPEHQSSFGVDHFRLGDILRPVFRAEGPVFCRVRLSQA
ncbi:hypothetical protein SDC9_68650 [bioreactor metagenome]|uniref:Uncharacterized protein n=1 Tax=bioreactor metagenome TaxID=1076179 RepID=A0A644Y1H3_9ZZZZ